MTRVVWTCGNFENNFGTNHNFTKFLKESSGLVFVLQFLLQLLFENPFFLRRISTKIVSQFWSFGCYKHEWISLTGYNQYFSPAINNMENKVFFLIWILPIIS